MTARSDSALDRFHPLVARWFTEEVGEPTPVQKEAWRQIAEDRHCVISAPTGTGKTLAAFLTSIDALVKGRSGRVLYVSPLKALNNDIERNLRRPLEALQRRFGEAGEPFPRIRVGVRSGDTDQSERRKLVTDPPEIFVTTPESLNLMLSSKSGLRGLEGFGLVILDEIHAVLSSKRGIYLMSAVERLVPICGEFQRVALSATVRPMERVAEIVGAFELHERGGEFSYRKRHVELVETASEKRYELTVAHPETESSPSGLPAPSGTPSSPGTPAPADMREEWWNLIVERLSERIEANRSTLIFANSRRMVEKLTRMLNDRGGEPVYAHHGSLSREIRRVVEERLKSGELRAIVATSSLELGIDIGTIDEVILVQAPFSVASAVQRIGRAGHGVGAVSKATFLPIHSRDLVESAVLARSVIAGAVEELSPPEAPLDLLAQIVLSSCLLKPVTLDELHRRLRCVYAYRDLERATLELVVEMLAGKYADSRIRELRPRLDYDRARGTIHARKNAPMLLYMAGGVIPDRGYFTLRISDTGAKIGELDEEFVWERSLGEAFPFGNRAWRITGITNNEVLVAPAERSNTVIPFWRAEELNRSFEYSQRIAVFLEETERVLADGRDLAPHLVETAYMEAGAAAALEEYLKRQRAHSSATLPHRHHVLIERYRDPHNSADAMQIVLHTLWGSKVNKPFAITVSAAWHEAYGYPLEHFANNDAVLFNLPHEQDAEALFRLLDGKDLSRLLRSSIEGSGLFGAHFRENAQRALLLPRKSFKERMPLWLNRLRAKKLLQATADREDFPVTLETWRECMQSEFDIPRLESLLDEIRRGEILTTSVSSDSPSPFADSIVWRQTNQRMYEDDSAESQLKTALSDELLEEILRSPHLRPELPRSLCETLRRKLHRLEPGYAPDTPEELLDWITERLYIPWAEWQELLAAMAATGVESPDAVVDAIRDRLAFVCATAERSPAAGREEPDGVLARENEGLIAALTPSGDADADEAIEPPVDRFLKQWLDYYPPQPLDRVASLLGLAPRALAAALDRLTENGELIVDRFTEGAETEEVCGRENLERLLRMRRAAARPDVEPLEASDFQLFLATHQGLANPGASLEDLEQRLELLFGYPARAALWESDLLPSRLSPYYPSWLDQAMGESDLVWVGCGKKRITFAFEEDLELIGPPEAAQTSIGELLSRSGRTSFLDLARAEGVRSDEASEALWQAVWQGRATNDGMEALRRGVQTDFRAERVAHQDVAGTGRRGRSRGRGGYQRWKSTRPMSGNWFAPEWPEPPDDPLEESELIKDRVRLVAARYGVLFRELLSRELAPLQWRSLFRTLRLMELSGELIAAHFVSGITGLQFVTPSTLRELSEPARTDAIYWMNAADPASLCGVDFEGNDLPLPRRLPTTHLVFHGSRLVLVSQRSGGELRFHVGAEAPSIQKYLSLFSNLLSRQQSPLKRIRTATINGEDARESKYADALRAFGFVADGPQLTLYRAY